MVNLNGMIESVIPDKIMIVDNKILNSLNPIPKSIDNIKDYIENKDKLTQIINNSAKILMYQNIDTFNAELEMIIKKISNEFDKEKNINNQRKMYSDRVIENYKQNQDNSIFKMVGGTGCTSIILYCI